MLPLAFAELQTDMVHVTSDICEQGGIPFRDYSSFCVRVMFPEDRSNDHPIMRSFDVSQHGNNHHHHHHRILIMLALRILFHHLKEEPLG